MPRLLCLALLACPLPSLPAAGPPPRRPGPSHHPARDLRPPAVGPTPGGRDGKTGGLAPGFVASADGLIATTQHVIGEGRAVAVELAAGTRHDVTAVHASDRQADLAVV